MCIALVPHIPDDLVFGRIEDIMEGNCKLNDAEARGEVAPCMGDSVDNKCAYLL